MNFKVSVILLHFFTITVTIGPYAATSFSVSASNVKSAEFASSNNGFDLLKATSVLYGITSIASTHPKATNQCHRELNQIYDGIRGKEIWAIKALDSSATPPPGFVLGNNFWLGSIQGCEAVQQPPPLTISDRFKRFMHDELWSATAPFEIGYRMVYAEHRSPFQVQVEFSLQKKKILHVGLCVPRSCSNDEIGNLTQAFFDSSTLTAQIIHDHQPNVLKVKDLDAKTNLLDKWSFRLIGFCVSFTLLMMLIAHLRERSENDGAVKTGNSSETRSQTNGNAQSGIVNASTSIPSDNSTKAVEAPKKPFMNEIVKCFSLRRNMQTLMSCKKPANAVPVVDGLKSIGCLVLVVFHVFWFNHFAVDNIAMAFSYGEHAIWQWIITAPNIVDVFFTISGLLFTYNFLRNQSKLDEIKKNNLWQNVKLFVKQVLHRYIRLTPVYLVVIGCMECLASRLTETSPFWIHDRNDENCSKYWWRNLLYIQNLFEFDEMCVPWSWSLACEMQFAILSTVLLFIYAKNPQAARKIFCSLVALCIGLLFSIAIFTKFTITYDVFYSLFNEMYIPPWTRVLPYLVGVATGYVMFTLKGKLPLSDKNIKIIWIVAAIVAISCHLTPAKRDTPYILTAIGLANMRVVYPASIAWMVLASHSAYGGFFAEFLNHPIFVHINRLSYGIYLLNPVVISALYGWQSHSTQVDPVSMMAVTTGINVLVYLSAVAFSLMFELPYANISGIILRPSSSKRKTVATSSTQPNDSTVEAKKSQ